MKANKKTEKRYIPRIVDSALAFKLRSKGAVWIRGPKWCGKSTTALRFANTAIMMQDESTRERNKTLAELDPSAFLEGDPPVLIDEWQTIPFIWNQIRLEIDRRDEFGQFILTGSNMPPDTAMVDQHSGIGRITSLLMRPMSLFESGESSGEISLRALFEGTCPHPAQVQLSLRDYAFLTARGGWPRAIGQDEDVSLQQAIDYYEGLVEGDITNLDEIPKDPERLRLFLRSYSRNCSTQATMPAIREDMNTNDGGLLDTDTIASYIKSMKRLFVIEESEAWNPNLRSKTAIRTSNTRYLIDPSIACAALGAGPDHLMKDLNTFGLLFENMCVRDLRVYSQAIDGTVKHFRDSSGLEIDAVVVLRDGSWGAIEVKLGGRTLISEGEKNLLKLTSFIGEGMRKPSFLMVLTAGNSSYRTKDGIWIVPLGCLGPRRDGIPGEGPREKFFSASRGSRRRTGTGSFRRPPPCRIPWSSRRG